MAGGPEIGPAGAGRSEAQRMANLPGGHFVVAGQAGQNGQPRGVGRSPAVRAQGVAAQIEDRAGVGLPATVGLGEGVEKLVEQAGGLIHHQHVAVAVAVRAAFDGRIRGDGIGAGIALVVVGEADSHFGLIPGHRHKGDADGAALPQARAEVGMQTGVAADGSDKRGRVRVDGQVIDGGVPDVVRGEEITAGHSGRGLRPKRGGRAAGRQRGEAGSQWSEQKAQGCHRNGQREDREKKPTFGCAHTRLWVVTFASAGWNVSLGRRAASVEKVWAGSV